MNGLHVAGLPDLWYGGFRRPLCKRVVEKTFGQAFGGGWLTILTRPTLPIWGDFRRLVALWSHPWRAMYLSDCWCSRLAGEQSREYVSGAYDISNQFKMYINRGVGHSTRVRFMARPEITVFTLAVA